MWDTLYIDIDMYIITVHGKPPFLISVASTKVTNQNQPKLRGYMIKAKYNEYQWIKK